MQTRAVRLLSLISEQTSYDQKNWATITNNYSLPLSKQKNMYPQTNFNALRKRKSLERLVFPIKQPQTINAAILLKNTPKHKQSQHIVTNHRIFSSLPKKNYKKNNYTIHLARQHKELPKEKYIDIINTIDLSKTVGQTINQKNGTCTADRQSNHFNFNSSPKIQKFRQKQYDSRRRNLRFRTKNSIVLRYSALKKHQLDVKIENSIGPCQKNTRNQNNTIVKILQRSQNSIQDLLRTVNSRAFTLESYNVSAF